MVPTVRTLFLLASSLVLIAGCGSGGSGGGNGGTTPVSAAERAAALAAVGAMVRSLTPDDIDANTQTLVQGIQALPQFAEAGSSPNGSVWGRFKNGMWMVIVPTTSPEDPSAAPLAVPGPPGAARHAARRLASSSASASAAAEGTVPSASTFRLLNGFGDYFDASDPRPVLAQMLTANGYQGTMEDATLANLRTRVKDVGVLYVRTHGGTHGRGSRDASGPDRAALWTRDEVLEPDAEEADPGLSDDLSFGRVVYMWARDDRLRKFFDPNKPLPFPIETNAHYGITEDFIRIYFTFGRNALVYIDACDSANPSKALAGDLDAGFTAAGAAVVAGWTDEASVDRMSTTARYVFDRLLGANLFAAESPKQRPFHYEALALDPRFGTGKPYGWSKVGSYDATLGFTPLQHEFGLLAPSIYGVGTIPGQDELMLLGLFGPDPGSDGKVTVDDGSGERELVLKSWAPDLIRAQLPRTGAGSFGNVLVHVRGHTSNTRQLLRWSGTFVHTLQELGSLTQRFNLDVVLRIDPHDVRNTPGAAPLRTPMVAAGMIPGLTAQFEASGTFSQPLGMCTLTTDWGGTGSIPAAVPNPLATRSYVYDGSIDRGRAVMQVVLAAADAQGGTALATQACPTGSTTVSAPVAMSASSVSFTGGSGTLDLPVDGSLNLVGGSRRVPVDSTVGMGQATFTLQWPTLSAAPPYDETLPR